MNCSKDSKKKIAEILNALKDPSYKKKDILKYTLQNLNYYELDFLYKRVPLMYKGLFSLSYLARHNYEQIFSTSIQPVTETIDYIGKETFIIVQHYELLNKYIKYRDKIDSLVLTGKYKDAKELLNQVNNTISYSYWAASYEIKIERFLNGQSSAIELHNKLFYRNKNNLWGKFCNAAYYTSTKDYVTDFERKLCYNGDSPYYTRLNKIIKSHYLSFDGIDDDEGMFCDMNSSIIDLYNNFINYLSCFTKQIYRDDDFKYFLAVLNKKINDIRIKNILNMTDVQCQHKTDNETRKSIVRNYLTSNFESSASESLDYLIEQPLDTEILLIYVKSIVLLKKEIDEPSQDASILQYLIYHLSCLFKHEDDLSYHFRKIKGLCRSVYNIWGVRYLYQIMKNYGENDLYNCLKDAWKYSEQINLADVLFFDNLNDRIKYLSNTDIYEKFIDELTAKNKKELTPDLFELSLGFQNGHEISLYLIELFQKRKVASFMKDYVASYVFAYYVNNNLLQDAVMFYVDENVNDATLDITVKPEHYKIIIDSQDSLIKEIPLDMSIFCTYINADVDTIYMGYKNYLRTQLVKRASEIIIDGNEKQKVFLDMVATQRVLTLHVLRFKSVEEVMQERINICSNLDNYYDDKTYSNEIAGICRDLKILELNNKVDESKIYVDIPSIRDNELEEAKALYKMYTQSNGLENIYHERIDHLIEIQKSENPNCFLRELYDINLEIINHKYDALERLFVYVRDQFLFSPKSGLDNYLSTRIRHGTLINQLRNNFEKESLITNKKNGIYTINDFWISKQFHLEKEQEKACSLKFENFSKKIDALIFEVKDEYVQILTEIETKKTKSFFNFEIKFFEDKIKSIQLHTELNNYESVLNEMFDILWIHTDMCLEKMRAKLKDVQNQMLEELITLEKDITEIIGKKNSKWAAFHDSVTHCRNNIQTDIQIVSRWFYRTNITDFNFTLAQVIETCKGFIDDHNKIKLKTNVECSSDTVIHGRYFATLYDMFHDILNNILYYVRNNNVKHECNINVIEVNDSLNIRVSNPIDEEQKDLLIKKADEINNNLHALFIGGKSRTEGKSGCIKIFNAVHNHLNSHKNDYLNSIENCEFVVKINICLNSIKV